MKEGESTRKEWEKAAATQRRLGKQHRQNKGWERNTAKEKQEGPQVHISKLRRSWCLFLLSVDLLFLSFSVLSCSGLSLLLSRAPLKFEKFQDATKVKIIIPHFAFLFSVLFGSVLPCCVLLCLVLLCLVLSCPVLSCPVVWCGVVMCGAVRCGAVWCGVVWCGVCDLSYNC